MKRIVISAIFLVCFRISFAQINPTVEVTRPFEVTLEDIHKPVIPSAVDDSLKQFDVSFDYSIFNRPYGDLYDFSPYEVVRLTYPIEKRGPKFTAKLGARYPLMPSGEIYLQGGRNNIYGSLYGIHDSFFGSVPFYSGKEDVDLARMRNTFGGSMTFDWKTGEFLLDAKYGIDRYGLDRAGRSADYNFDGFEVTGNMRSAHSEKDGLYYDIEFGFSNSTFGNDGRHKTGDVVRGTDLLRENRIIVKGFVGSTFDVHRVCLDMNVEYAMYDVARDFTSAIVELAPIYQLERKNLSARIGIKFGTRYGKIASGNDPEGILEPTNNFFPDLDARLELWKNTMWIHAVVTGGNDLNDFLSLYRRMPVLSYTSQYRFGTKPVDASLTLETLTLGRLAVNFNSGFNIAKDRVYFAPEPKLDDLHTVYSAYMDVNELSYGVQAKWHSESFEAGGSFTRHIYVSSDRPVTEFPAVTADAYVRYNYRERLGVSADMKYRSEVAGMRFGVYEVPSLLNVDVNLNYMVNKHLTFYLNCGNILDRRNQYVPLYIEPGRNFGAGICLNF